VTTGVTTVMTVGTETLARLLLASITRKQITLRHSITKTKPMPE
jgi:hypothetical protein